MPPSIPFRWVDSFRRTSRDSNTSTIYTQPTAFPIDPSIDPRVTVQASTYNNGSHRFALDIEEGFTDDDEPIVEYHTIRHIPTEYGTAVDHRQMDA